jgi:hypothetical protein
MLYSSQSGSQGFRVFGFQSAQLLFSPATLFFASSNSAIPGSASFQREEFLMVLYGFSLPSLFTDLIMFPDKSLLIYNKEKM